MTTPAPGPPGELVLGNARRFQRDLIQTLLDGCRDHGDVVRFDGIGPLFPVYLVAHPDGVKHVLQDNHRNYPKTPFVNNRWRALVGEGLICSEGDFWRQQRRLCQPVFQRSLVKRFAGTMTESTGELLTRWAREERAGREIDLTTDMTRLALSVLGQALFDANWRKDADAMAAAVEVTIGEAYRRFGQFVSIPDSIPTPANRRFAASKARLDEIIYRVIEHRRAAALPHPDDLLEALLTATLPDGSHMPVEQVRNEVMTFMFGGHETVAAGLTWALHLLSRHVEVTRRLEREVRDVLGGRLPTLADLEFLPYSTKVVHECLRLYPPVWLISRTPSADDSINGYRIPAGSMVLLSPYVTHRHPDVWVNPDGFDPDRWDAESVPGNHRFAWWPFSGGPRKCIGDFFGQLEMQLVIVMITQRFRVESVPGVAAVPKPGITLGQQEHLMVRLRALADDPEPDRVDAERGDLAKARDTGPVTCPYPHHKEIGSVFTNDRQ